MSDHKKTLDEIIEQFNTEVGTIREAANEVLEAPSYTYVGEHYDHLPRDLHWSKQFASTELAVSLTEAISYAVRDGLTNADVAVVLGKILSEVKQRQ